MFSVSAGSFVPCVCLHCVLLLLVVAVAAAVGGRELGGVEAEGWRAGVTGFAEKLEPLLESGHDLAVTHREGREKERR